MAFFFEGNGYFESSYLTNSTVKNVIVSESVIKTSQIDMLNSAGNYQNITNVALPINLYDVVNKLYVDNLNIQLNTYTINGTSNVTVLNNSIGSFNITVYSNITGAPHGCWAVSKSFANTHGHIVRNNFSPGYPSFTSLQITWPPNTGITMNKSNGNYDGVYTVKAT
jgi:hypothetical protein